MYSPTTRLLTVLELLQSHHEMSGAELARRLEVDRRSVRRYIVTLQDMGIPVEAERGPYGAYRLRRGYKLPPLMFTEAEAIALTLGLLAIRSFRFPVDMVAVEGALAKTERVMPEHPLNTARGLQQAISFYATSAPDLPQNDTLAVLSSAAQQQRQVTMSYQPWSGEARERNFDPYGIVFNDGYWYAAGYCHLREDLRTFRLDRIVALEAREETFERPADFDALSYVLNSIALMSGTRQVEVMLETTMEYAQSMIPPVLGSLEPSDRGVILRRAATQLGWLAHVLLQLDCPVVIVQPDELCDTIRQLGMNALRIAGESR